MLFTPDVDLPHMTPACVQARGDVPSLSIGAADDFNGTVAVSAAASLEGIAPLWGTFELEYDGETTSPIYVDATAGEQCGSNGLRCTPSAPGILLFPLPRGGCFVFQMPQ